MSFTYKDQLGDTILLEEAPHRIVSLVPSQTELLFDIGAGTQVVGVTKFCIHPDAARKDKTIVGGTKNYHLDQIRALQPDLIIGNKEENMKESILELKKEFQVWMSDIQSLEDALDMIVDIGQITGHQTESRALANEISTGFDRLKKLPARRVLYFIWKKPYMVAAANTFIDHLLTRIGLVNAADHLDRYPDLTPEEIRDIDPELILLSSEPYPFKQSDKEEIARICPRARIIPVDGELFSWYGSRLKKAPPYFAELLYTAL